MAQEQYRRGSARKSVDNLRNKGWQIISKIVGIVSKMPDQHNVEIGLKINGKNTNKLDGVGPVDNRPSTD